MRAGVSTVASALLLCSWAPLGIAGTDPTAAGKASSEEMILFEDLPSVFGASKYAQKSSEAPASVSVVTADEIQKYGYRTLSEILRSVRGLFTTYDRNYSYAGVRGFDRPGDYDTRMLLLLDGHRLNDDVYDQAMIGTEAPIDVEMIDHVEIIRGPSSSLYGTDAFFAVVNVVTKSGRQMQGGEVAIEGSSYSTGRGRTAYGKKLDTGREVLLSGTFYDSGGQRLFFPEFDSPAANNGFADRADDDRYGRLFGKLSVGDLTLEAGASSREKGIPTASFGTVFDDPSSRTVDSRGFLDLTYDRAVSDATRLIASVSFDAYRYNGDYLYTTGLAKDYGYGRWWTAEGRAISTLGERQKLIYGAEFRYNAQQDQGYYQVTPYASYLRDRRHSTIGALYVQDEIRLRPKVILNLGVRHDSYDNFGGTTNPRLAFIAGLGQASTLKLLYGQAFRAPNAYELYYYDGTFQKSNPGLSPERIETYEADLEHPFRRGLRGVASVYQYDTHDLISLEIDPSDGFHVFENADRVRSRGIEVELDGRIAGALDGRVSYAYQKSQDQRTGIELTNSPRHLAKLNLSRPFRNDALTAGLEVQYVGRRGTIIGDHTGAYALTNLTLLGRSWKRGPTLSLSIYNLFDVRYGDPGSEEHVQQVIPQDRRNYRLFLKYDF